MIPEDFLNWKRITMVNKSKTPFFPISPCKRYPLGIWKIGNAASVTGLYKFHLIYWLFVFISEIQIYMIIISTLKIHFLYLIAYLMNSKPLKTQNQSLFAIRC